MALDDGIDEISKINELFAVGAGEKAETDRANVMLTYSQAVTSGKMTRIIDTPGVEQSKHADIKHIRHLVDTIRASSQYIKLFSILINGQTRGEQLSTIQSIAIYEQIFGSMFWSQACIIITHFSSSPEQKAIRDIQGVTRGKKEKAILRMINQHFPESMRDGLQVPVFFTDCFDLGREYDTTKSEVSQVCKLAQQNSHYDTDYMRKCVYSDWQGHKDRILQQHMTMQAEIQGTLGKDETKWFLRNSDKVVAQLKDDAQVIEYSKKDFEVIEKDLQRVRDKAEEKNRNRLTKEKTEAEIEKAVQRRLAEAERTLREVETKRANAEQQIAEQRRIEVALKRQKSYKARLFGAILVAGTIGYFCYI